VRDALDRQGLLAALGCFVLWGLFPLLFDAMGALGATPFEIVGWRTVFAIPCAGLLVFVVGRGAGLASLLRAPAQLALLALSAGLIAVNWTVYIAAVTSGATLSASLGYFINPLVNLAIGAIFFRERISPTGRIGVALAAAGVLVQALALHALPFVPLVLAFSFGGYGAVRKFDRADAQTGLFVECVFLLIPALILLAVLGSRGALHFGHGAAVSLLLVLAGPATVLPLAAFAFAARRLPLSMIGALQYLSPTLQFLCGLALGERLRPATVLAFSLIWAGVVVFSVGAVQDARRGAHKQA